MNDTGIKYQSLLPQSLRAGVLPPGGDSVRGESATVESSEEDSEYLILLEALHSPLQVIAANSTTISANTAQTVDRLKTLDTGLLEITSLLDKLQLELEQHTKALLFLLQKEDAVLEGMRGGGNTLVESGVVSARQLAALDYKVLEIHNILQKWQLEKDMVTALSRDRSRALAALKFCRALPSHAYSQTVPESLSIA
ncbi:hypothetical protein DL98DRAFT_525604 [Cadophora sp. DSE1049]|nr:hypothetical protein DL98DRAFT_525604 [Cadophora sp. DSE1049]